MNLAQARKQWPNLNDYSDQELLDIVAQQNGIEADDPRRGRLEQELLGYGRTWGEVAKDTALQVGQGVANLGGLVASGLGTWDNPVARTFGEVSDALEPYKSQGLQNMQAGAYINSQIAEREAQARGAGWAGRLASDFGAQIENYWNAPGLIAQDVVTNAPQLLAGGLVGRGVSTAARAAGLGARAAGRTGLGAAVGTTAALQGTDVGSDTYQRAIQAGATPEQATALANEAALKAGAVSLGLTLLPGGATIERGVMGGATARGLRPIGTRARLALTDTAGEAVEEGYGQFAGNQGVQQVDPSVDLLGGVGQSAAQGAVASGPISAWGAARHKFHPRTADGEVDLTRPAEDQAATEPEMVESRDGNVTVRYPADVAAPAAQRRGDDPLNERSSPWTPPQPEPPAPLMVSRDGVVMPWQTPEQLAGMDAARAQQAQQAASAEEEQSRRATRGDLLRIIQDVKKSYVRKDGELANTPGGLAMRPILESDDPAATIREMYGDGGGTRDDVLDAVHERLTGLHIDEFQEQERVRAAEETRAANPDVNSAGFVPEPIGDITAQIQAVKDKRKTAVVLGVEEADQVNPSGLARATVTDPATGEAAVVMTRTKRELTPVRKRVKEVGLRQALGELQGVVDPTATSTPTSEPTVAVQQADNETGAVLADEVVPASRVAEVTPVPGTTAEVVPVEAPVARRRRVRAAPPAAATQLPAGNPAVASPAPAPAVAQPVQTRRIESYKYGRKTLPELIQIIEDDNTADPNAVRAAYLQIMRLSERDDETADAADAYLVENMLPGMREDLNRRLEAEQTAKQQALAPAKRERRGPTLDERPDSEVLSEIRAWEEENAREPGPFEDTDLREPDKPGDDVGMVRHRDTQYELFQRGMPWGKGLSPEGQAYVASLPKGQQAEFLRRALEDAEHVGIDGEAVLREAIAADQRAARAEEDARAATQPRTAVPSVFEPTEEEIAALEAVLDQGRRRVSGYTPRVASTRPRSTNQTMTPQQVEQAVRQALATVSQKLGRDVPFRVIKNGSRAVPPTFVTAKGTVLNDGTVVVFSDAAESADDILRTVFHELFHRGVKVWARSNEQYTRALLRLLNDPAIANLAHQWIASEHGRSEAVRFRRFGAAEGRHLDNYYALAVEESLAQIAEQGPQNWAARTATALRNFVADLAHMVGLKRLSQRLRVPGREANEFVAQVLAMSGGEIAGSDTATYRFGSNFPDGPDDDPGGGGATPAPLRTASLESRWGARRPAMRGMSTAAKIAGAVRAQAAGREINPALLKLLTMRQLVEQFGNKLPAMRDVADALFERSSHSDRMAAQADRTARKWEAARATPAQRKDLNEILLRASEAELQLDNTSPEYIRGLDERDRALYQSLRQRLVALPPELQQIRREVLDAFREQWAFTRRAVRTLITHTISDPDIRAQRIGQLDEELGRNRGDYFPLSRFGDRIVIARGAGRDGGDIVTMHETAAEADAQVRALKARGAKDVVVNLATVRDPRMRATTGFMGELHTMIASSDADQSAKDQMHDALQQIYLRSLPEMSGAKNMIRRRNIEGASTDAPRVFADAIVRGSHYAARLDYAPRISAAMESAEIQSRSTDQRSASVVIGRKDGSPPVVSVTAPGMGRYDAINRMVADGYSVTHLNVLPGSETERITPALEGFTPEQVSRVIDQAKEQMGRSTEGVEDLRAAKSLYNHLVKMQQFEPNDGALDKAVDVLGQAGYVWFLGATPAFWMMNMLQNPMIGIPHLGGKYGLGNAAREWGAAMRWFSNVRMGKLLKDRKEPFSIAWLRKQNIPGITKEELDMLQYQEDRQLIDFTQARDLGRIGSASNGRMHKWLRLAAAGAHHTEVFNRVTFALAAYRLAMKSSANMTHEQAVRRVEHDLAATHFDYSTTNKAALMKGRASRLVFMFQQYRQHLLYWWANTIKDAIKGESKEDRSAARKAAVLMGLSNAAFAGAMGMPFMGAVSFLANAFAPDDDDGIPFDFERWLTEAAVEATGSERAAQALTRGIFTLVNMNIGQRVGQADLIPFLNENGSSRFADGPGDKMRAMIVDALGPLGSIAVTAARSTDAFARGDTLAGLAAVTPKAVSDVLKSIDLSTNGVRTGQGDTLALAEEFGVGDRVLQAIGVYPSNVARIKQNRGAIIELQQEIQDRRSRLTKGFVQAWTSHDREGMRESMADIQEYNKKVTSGRLRAVPNVAITSRSLESAIRSAQQTALMRALTGGQARDRQQLMLALSMSGLIDRLTMERLQQNALDLPALPGLPGG